jgi:hypothetical protein
VLDACAAKAEKKQGKLAAYPAALAVSNRLMRRCRI